MERKEKILGVEGGGTKTAWVLVERTRAGGADPGSQLRILDQGRLPPSNVRLETPDRLRAIFCELPSEIDRAGIFLAGCGPPRIDNRFQGSAPNSGQTPESSLAVIANPALPVPSDMATE